MTPEDLAGFLKEVNATFRTVSRLWLAGQALSNQAGCETPEKVAASAVAYADAVLAELDKKPKPEICDAIEINAKHLIRHYPWDDWLDGQTRHLVWGVHFECNPGSLRAKAAHQAAKRGLRVTFKIKNRKDVYLRALAENGKCSTD